MVSTNFAIGQDVFHTRAAEIKIKVRHHGHVSNFYSNKLVVLIDYSDASFKANLKLKDIRSDDTLLEEELVGLQANEFVLSGKFGLDQIETSTHRPLQFDYKGILSYTGNRLSVYGVGQLEHIDGGEIACLLSFNFDIDSAILPDDIKNRHRVEDISVEVLQSILKPEGN